MNLRISQSRFTPNIDAPPSADLKLGLVSVVIARFLDRVRIKWLNPCNMASNTFSFDVSNPKYRQLNRGNDILEYTLVDGEIIVDWVNGRDVASMLKTILAVDGDGVTKISGYVTDKLGRASSNVLLRLGNQIANHLGGGWKATLQTIESRRYLVLMKYE